MAVAAAAPIDAGPPQQLPPGPRFGQSTTSHTSSALDYDRLEYYFGDDCELPSSLPKPSLPGPPLMDWGKVTRGPIDVVATLDTGAERDMQLYEIAGARGTYLFDGRNASLAGTFTAHPGDLVALCPEHAPNRWQLPGDLHDKPLTTVRFAGVVAGPPQLGGLPYVHPHAPPYATKQKTWPFPDRFVTYVHDPRLTSDGKYYNYNWYFELDASQPALPQHFNALMVADKPRFEERDGRTVVVVHAVSFREHMFAR